MEDDWSPALSNLDPIASNETPAILRTPCKKRVWGFMGCGAKVGNRANWTEQGEKRGEGGIYSVIVPKKSMSPSARIV
jgi:hypothetical protein